MHTLISTVYYDHWANMRSKLESAFLDVLKNQRIKRASLNILRLFRYYFITKETMEGICKGIIIKDKHGNDIGKESINDDSEKFIESIQQQDLKSETKLLYFLPKISDDEKKYFPTEDTFRNDYIQVNRVTAAIEFSKNPDVPPEEMERSESTSKYCYSFGRRKTSIYENYQQFPEPIPSFEAPLKELKFNLDAYTMYHDFIKDDLFDEYLMYHGFIKDDF